MTTQLCGNRTSGDTVRSDELTLSISTLPEFSLDIENREQLITNGQMSISGVINAHNGLDLSLGGVLDVIVEPYNEALLQSAVISWGAIDSNGDLPFTVTFSVDDNTPRNEYTVQLNVVSLDGGIAHAASVAFVTESSTLDGTAEAQVNHQSQLAIQPSMMVPMHLHRIFQRVKMRMRLVIMMEVVQILNLSPLTQD